MICGIVVAHNESGRLKNAIDRLNLPYIAVLDNPTDEVIKLTESAIRRIIIKDDELEHVYNWQNVLDRIKKASDIAKELGYKWVIRSDADEDWHSVAEHIYKADRLGCNVVNFRIAQYKPCNELSAFFVTDQQVKTEYCDDIHLEPDGNSYERAYKLDANFNLGGGGHVILREGKKTYQACYAFKHYPFKDKSSIVKKSQRKVNESEKAKGWHIQYNTVKPPIYAYYHLAQMGCWRKVLGEQVNTVIRSGFTDKIHYICQKKEPKLPSNWECVGKSNLEEYEFPTLKAMEEHAKREPEALFLYFHSKGVSKHIDRRWLDTKWRKYMMWGCVENWKDCVDKLMNGYDVAGVEWYPDVIPTKTGGRDGDCHGFFAGNFFWATGKFINRLPSIDTLDISNRWNAEAWIGLGDKPKVYELQNMGCQHRQGMFHHGFCRDHYTQNIVYVDASRYRQSGKQNVYGMIKELVSDTDTVMVFGVGQKYLKDYMQVKQEPMQYSRKIKL